MSSLGPTPPTSTARRAAYAVAASVVVVLVVMGALALSGHEDGPASRAGQPGAGSSSSAASPGSGSTPSGSATPSKGASRSTAPSSIATTRDPAAPPTGPVNPAKPQKVRLRQAGQPAPGVTARIVRVESVRARGHIPGEVSGPGLRLTVQVDNARPGRIPSNTAVANLYYGADRTPATPFVQSGARALPRFIPARGSATGVFVFSVPVAQRTSVVLELDLSTRFRVVQFVGDCRRSC